MTPKDNQPSEQTVREILTELTALHYDEGGSEEDGTPYGVKKAEAAINAHIVSVLDSVHKQCDNCEGGRRITIYASGDKYEEAEYEFCDEDLHTAVDAAIAKYKSEEQQHDSDK